jgi:hypothetical protein
MRRTTASRVFIAPRLRYRLLIAKPLAILLLIAGAVGAWFGFHQSEFLAAASTASLLIALAALTGLIKPPRKEMDIRARRDSTFTVLPRQLRSERLRRIAVPLSIASVIFASFSIHAAVRPGPLSDAAKSLVMAAALSVILLAVVLARATVQPPYGQPRLTINTDHPLLDHTFHITVDFDIRKPIHIEACRARVRCLENVLLHMGRYTQLVVRPHTEQSLILAENETFSPRQTLLADGEILLQSGDHLPTGKSGWTSYPHYTWQIDIEIIGDRPSKTVFPITVFTERPVVLS